MLHYMVEMIARPNVTLSSIQVRRAIQALAIQHGANPERVFGKAVQLGLPVLEQRMAKEGLAALAAVSAALAGNSGAEVRPVMIFQSRDTRADVLALAARYRVGAPVVWGAVAEIGLPLVAELMADVGPAAALFEQIDHETGVPAP